MIVILAGCSGEAPEDTAGPAPDSRPELAPLVAPSAACPVIAPGEVTFRSGGVDRRVLIAYPADAPPGMPVLTVWHGLGQDPERMVDQMDLVAFADANRVVAVAPASLTPTGATWDVYAGGLDAVLYDDLRTCLANQLGVDLERVWAAGFSFGSWWVTWLAENRGDTLAAIHELSGGVADDTVPYAPLPWAMPVLLEFGGADDVYDDALDHHFVFADTTAAFADALTADGHLVVTCDHGGGHRLPDDVAATNAAWFPPHVFGGSSPFAANLDGLPAGCR
ncbi:MAG: hypothetical protein ABMB14_21070 [Myxococcota bacterium]